ncbi:hypothetical protein [Actibacterium sp. MT2.3-13A]|nr:hypothetical protein [Actibacterium sp. MT2.3-13A]
MRKPGLRRDKRSPCEDFWHTLRWGVPVGLVLMIVLPWIMA